MDKSNKTFQRNLLLFASIFALSFAYVGEYVFGLDPCTLCIYQRVPYFFVILFCVFGFIAPSFKKCSIDLSFLALIICCAIALYHVGVEKHLIIEPSSCSLNIEGKRCSEIQFSFLGISMAGLNAIYSGSLSIFLLYNRK